MKRIILWLLFGALFVACGGGTSSTTVRPTTPLTPTEPSTTGVWSQGEAMPTARSGAASAVLDGKMYVVGGLLASGQSTDAVEAYDPATDAWQTLAPLPVPLADEIALALSGKIYVAGGYTAAGSGATNTTYEYDPGANVWTPRAAMPFARAAGAAGTAGDGLLYIMGGAGDKAGDVQVYDPALDSWTDRPESITPRDHLTGQSLGTFAVAIGGQSGGQEVNTAQVYNAASNQWLPVAAMPTARSGLASATLGRNVHVVGGQALSTNTALVQHEVYNPDSNSWAPAPPLPTARYGLTAQAVGDKLYAIGGTTADGAPSALVEIFALSQ